MEDDFLSVKKAAKMLGISTATIRKWCDDGVIKCMRLPTGVRRIRKSEIDRIIEQGEDSGRSSQDP